MALQDFGVRRQHSSDNSFLIEVVNGLSQPQKSLPSRFFYDAAGSELFEKITGLPEYYPTRVECALLTAHAADMVEAFGTNSVLVEFGSGSSTKTELLLQNLPECAVYAPIDVSQAALRGACSRLAHRFPDLEVVPVVADFATLPRLPHTCQRDRSSASFPDRPLVISSPPKPCTSCNDSVLCFSRADMF